MTAEYLIPEEVNKYLRNGIVNVKVIKTTSKWYGITYKEDLQLIKDEIKKLISDGVYPENLWK